MAKDSKLFAELAKKLWHVGSPLSKKEIEALARAVDSISSDIIINVAPVSMRAYLLAYRIRELIKNATNVADIRKILDGIKSPANNITKHSEVLAAISKMINKPVEHLVDKTALEFINQYMFSDITWKLDDMQNKIRHEMVETLRNYESPLALARKLHKVFDNYKIDMRRVAITETTRARNEATLNAESQEDPRGEDTLVYFLVAKDACKMCKKLYLYPDGTPRLFKISDLRGKSNKNIPQKDWVAAIIIHPNDRCIVMKYRPQLQEWIKKWDAKYKGKTIHIEPDIELKKSIPNDPVKKVAEVNGVKIAVEYPKGSIRFKGKPFEKKMECDYGYIHGTNSEHDDMDLDVYLGPNHNSKKVWEMDQLKKDGTFDEKKYALGFNNRKEFRDMYIKHMPAEWYGGSSEITWQDFEHIIATNLKTPELNKALGDERTGHKYLKRIKNPKTGKWDYIYKEGEGPQSKKQEETPKEKIPAKEESKAVPTLDNLATEASKYKSAEEFINSINDISKSKTGEQFKRYEHLVQFHGTQKGKEVKEAMEKGTLHGTIDGLMGTGFYVTSSKDLGAMFGKQEAIYDKTGAYTGRGGTNKEPTVFAIDLSGLNIKEIDWGKGEYYAYLDKHHLSQEQFNKQLKKEGYDGLNLVGRGETVIFYPEKVKEFNYKEFYNKAVGKEEKSITKPAPGEEKKLEGIKKELAPKSEKEIDSKKLTALKEDARQYKTADDFVNSFGGTQGKSYKLWEELQKKMDASKKAYDTEEAIEKAYPTEWKEMKQAEKDEQQKTQKYFGKKFPGGIPAEFPQGIYGEQLKELYNKTTGQKVSPEGQTLKKSVPDQIEGVTKSGVWKNISHNKPSIIHGLHTDDITGHQGMGTQGEPKGTRAEYDKAKKNKKKKKKKRAIISLPDGSGFAVGTVGKK